MRHLLVGGYLPPGRDRARPLRLPAAGELRSGSRRGLRADLRHSSRTFVAGAELATVPSKSSTRNPESPDFEEMNMYKIGTTCFVALVLASSAWAQQTGSQQRMGGQSAASSQSGTTTFGYDSTTPNGARMNNDSQ